MVSAVQVSVTKETAILGKPMKRLEDPKFITGIAKYIDDVKLPGVLHAKFVRSLEAHSKISKVDVSQALQNPSVRLVLTGREIAAKVGNLPTLEQDEQTKSTARPVLASDHANFAGEPIAMVVAEDRYSAEDAADDIAVEYEPLPVVSDPEAGMKSGSPRVHDYLPDNIAYHLKLEAGEIGKAFRAAQAVVKLELTNQLVAAVSMEPRGVLASYDSNNDFLTLWLSTQNPFEAREELAEILRHPESRIRVIAPNVGGAFGSKIATYPEEVAVAVASMILGRPVKWVETRRENLLSTAHGRGQKQYVEAAVRKDGRVLGLRVKLVADAGAYSTWGSAMLPESTVRMAPGCYDIGAYSAELFSVFTNKVPQDAYRGAGRPEATYLIERTMNLIASRLKLDPVKVRVKNFIPKNRFPFGTATGEVYDSGDYEGTLRKALEVSHFERLRIEQTEARDRGRFLGIGIASYVELCGFGPSYPQTAAVTVMKDGHILLNLGTNPQGQGHSTPFAQIVSTELGVELSDISVNYGDTMGIPWGTMTAGSRSAVVGGSAVLLAARRIREKMTRIAAKRFDMRNERIILKDGKFFPAGAPRRSIKFEDVAALAYRPDQLPKGMEPTLFEYCAFAPPTNVFPFGTHIAVVEVDSETGAVKILKYFAVDDVGNVLNPLVVEGQVHGGVVQGIGQALLERIVYDEHGQLLTSTLADYLIPSLDTAPRIESHRTVTPAPSNPLGVKGVGEAGTIAATPAIVNAVEDALSPFNVTIERMPLAPDYLRELIRSAEDR